jgi:cytoskeletal protein RodZ
MRKKRDVSEEIEEIEEEESELSEKELKKKKQKEGAEKRKNAKKKDKVARWGGLILLGLVMFVGFLLWVSGEMKQENIPLNPPSSEAGQRNITPFESQIESRSGSTIIVK